MNLLGSKDSARPSGKNHLVASGLDDNFVYPFCVWLSSLLASKSSNFDLIVGFLPGKLSTENQEFVVRFCDALDVTIILKQYESHDLFQDIRHLTSTTFLKFRISDEVSSPHLWIDLDTIGLAGWDSIFTDVNLASDADGLVVARKLDQSSTSFNAGVLGWPRGLRRSWVQALRDLPEERFSAEQGLFNLLYGETAWRVSVSYNLVSFWVESIDSDNLPKILHFAGPSKPWHLDRRLAAHCYRHSCPWRLWFDAEAELWNKTLPRKILDELATQRLESLAKSPPTQKEDFFSMRIIRWLGDAGRTKLVFFYLIQFVISLLRIPIRNLHPFHGGQGTKIQN